LRRGIQDGFQLIYHKWLDEVVVKPRLHRTATVLLASVSRGGDQQSPTHGGNRTQLSRNLPTVQARQHQVKKHHVWNKFAGNLQGLVAADSATRLGPQCINKVTKE
jgi:hypothetical protein